VVVTRRDGDRALDYLSGPHLRAGEGHSCGTFDRLPTQRGSINPLLSMGLRLADLAGNRKSQADPLLGFT
jgi:hypothetical protein